MPFILNSFVASHGRAMLQSPVAVLWYC